MLRVKKKAKTQNKVRAGHIPAPQMTDGTVNVKVEAVATEKHKKGLPLGQTLTGIISVLALTLSAASFYYQFIFDNEELKATLMNVDIVDGEWRATLLLINNGSRPAGVQNMTLTTGWTSDPPSNEGTAARVRPILSVESSHPFPLAVKPKESLTVDLKAPFKVSELYNFGVQSTHSNGEEPINRDPDSRQLALILVFTSMTSRGKTVQTETEVMKATLGKNQVSGGCGSVSKTLELLKAQVSGVSDH